MNAVARAGWPLPPTSSLPPLRSLDALTEDVISSALQNLFLLYCPLPVLQAFQSSPSGKASNGQTVPSVSVSIDSGYTSGNDDDSDEAKDARARLRADAFERNFALRWLTSLLVRAEEAPCLGADEDARQLIVDQASCILGTLLGVCPAAAAVTADEDDDDDHSSSAGAEDGASLLFARDFSFRVPHSGDSSASACADQRARDSAVVTVRLNDGLAGTGNADHTDVGLQSWSASAVFCEMVCASPARFQFTQTVPDGPAALRIVELGAGTGLVSLVLARLLPLLGVVRPTIIATDYHPTVLENLAANVAANRTLTAAVRDSDSDQNQDQEQPAAPAAVHTCALDWSNPRLEPPLDAPANILVATDAVYAPEHAAWLLDCAARLLAPDGVFWLMATVRKTGRFEGISETVEAAFSAGHGSLADTRRALRILDLEVLEMRRGVGRGDESGYKLFRIGWT